MLMILLVICILFALFGLPQVGGQWHSYGYAPSGIAVVIVVILLVFLLMGRM